MKKRTKKDDESRAKAWFHAAERGDVSALRALLAEDAALLNRGDPADYHNPALSIAAWSGRANAVRFLLQHKAKSARGRGAEGLKVDARNSMNDTALILACTNGQPDVAKLLVEGGGAKVNAREDDGLTPLMCCAHFDMPRPKAESMIRLLLKNGAKKTLRGKTGETALELYVEKVKGKRGAVKKDVISELLG